MPLLPSPPAGGTGDTGPGSEEGEALAAGGAELELAEPFFPLPLGEFIHHHCHNLLPGTDNKLAGQLEIVCLCC